MTGFSYVVAVDGLSALRDLETIPDSVKINAQRAVNYALDRTRKRSADMIREQVAFPPSYLNPSQQRLYVARYAKPGDLEGSIIGRFRPTSLARFAKNGRVGDTGLDLEIEPGRVVHIKNRMFLIRLKAGRADLDTKSNMGLAIRLRPGERIEGKYKQVQMGNGLTLLYGPSVNQVFRNVADEVSPFAHEQMEREFLRLMGLD